MAKAKPLTVINVISIDGAEPVPLESLSKEQMEEVGKIWSERLGESISEYLANHPEEIPVVKKCLEKHKKE